ncbi:hypothetical protein Lser_V15G28822 [Lactuca serriola]
MNFTTNIGNFDHGACIDYVSNKTLHVGNSSSETPFPMLHNKGDFGIQNSLTDSIPESEWHNYFLEHVHGCVQIASLRSSGYGFLEDSKEAWEVSRELVLGKWDRHEVGVENLVTANKISHCDDYLISD